MKWIVAGALSGWTGIVALAWWLADRRTRSCSWDEGEGTWHYDTGCALRAAAARDNTLIGGLTIALIGLIAVAVIARRQRLNRPGGDQARPAQPHRLP